MTYYLVHCDTRHYVDKQVFIGISDSKLGLMELLYCYHKYYFATECELFEECFDDIQIYSISELHYNFLLDTIKMKEDIIDDILEKNFKSIGYSPEKNYSHYVNIILTNDEEDYTVFDKTLQEKYYDIILEATFII